MNQKLRKYIKALNFNHKFPVNWLNIKQTLLDNNFVIESSEGIESCQIIIYENPDDARDGEILTTKHGKTYYLTFKDCIIDIQNYINSNVNESIK